MNSDNIIEQRKPKPVIARRKGELGAVMVDPKTGKPIPDTWVTKAKVPEKALKYLDPTKFAAAEKRNKDRQAQIDAEKERLKGVGNPPVTQPPVGSQLGSSITKLLPSSSTVIEKSVPRTAIVAVGVLIATCCGLFFAI